VLPLDGFPGVLAHERDRSAANGPDERVTARRVGLGAPFVKRRALTEGCHRSEHVCELDVEDLVGWYGPEAGDDPLDVVVGPPVTGEGVPAVSRSQWEVGNVEAETKVGMVLNE
jgi:hypothetical protein